MHWARFESFFENWKFVQNFYMDIFPDSVQSREEIKILSQTSTGFRWCSKAEDCSSLAAEEGGDGRDGSCFRFEIVHNLQRCTRQPFFASGQDRVGQRKKFRSGARWGVKSSVRGRVAVKLGAFSGQGRAGRASLITWSEVDRSRNV